MKRPGPGRATEEGLGPLRWSTSRSRRRFSSRCKSGETVQSLTGYPKNSNPHTTGEDGAHKRLVGTAVLDRLLLAHSHVPGHRPGAASKISTRGGRGSSRSRGRIGKRRSGGAQGSTFGRYERSGERTTVGRRNPRREQARRTARCWSGYVIRATPAARDAVRLLRPQPRPRAARPRRLPAVRNRRSCSSAAR